MGRNPTYPLADANGKDVSLAGLKFWMDKRFVSPVGLRPAMLAAATDTLFLTTRGNTFHPNNLSALMRSYLVAAGITKRGSCHIFRHTAATLMLEGGADLRSIQTLLGHEQLNTTQIYTHVTIQRLRDVHEQTHPGATDRHPDKAEDKAEDKELPPQEET